FHAQELFVRITLARSRESSHATSSGSCSGSRRHLRLTRRSRGVRRNYCNEGGRRFFLSGISRSRRRRILGNLFSCGRGVERFGFAEAPSVCFARGRLRLFSLPLQRFGTIVVTGACTCTDRASWLLILRLVDGNQLWSALPGLA